MELKGYQKEALQTLDSYLTVLKAKVKPNERYILDAIAEDRKPPNFDFPSEAWEEFVGRKNYISRTDNASRYVPNVCVKLPTGGGKTILACHTIDSINRIFKGSRTGLVVWIVPSETIYNQTMKNLKDRDHSYRRVLDMASGGRTKVIDKNTSFTQDDVNGNLVILILMLQSFTRNDPDPLKVFSDDSKFANFFPPDSDSYAHKRLIRDNGLDTLGEGFLTRIAKTSLGNALRILRPIVIMDEGHRARTIMARESLFGLNPSIVVEFTATPNPDKKYPIHNILVDIPGRRLLADEMIKLDMHLILKPEDDWEATMREAVAKLNSLQRDADSYFANSKYYIRPICLVQAEATGERVPGKVHAEDVREFLIQKLSIDPDTIKVQTSKLKELKDEELMSKDSKVKFIITMRALQEGWDCPYAYVLVVLTNPQKKLAMTQLVGRILRQPYAKKTGISDLDESFVYCRHHSSDKVMNEIKSAFQDEGMADLSDQIQIHLSEENDKRPRKYEILHYRDKFRQLVGKIYLPKFVVMDNGKPRNLNYVMDLLSRLDWSRYHPQCAEQYNFDFKNRLQEETTFTLADGTIISHTGQVIKTKVHLEVSALSITRQISDLVLNPWEGYRIGDQAISILRKRTSDEVIGANMPWFIDFLRNDVDRFRDEVCQAIFNRMLDNKELFFYLIRETSESKKDKYLTERAVLADSNWLTHNRGVGLQRSLFEQEVKDSLNESEKAVALYLDEQEKLLWWFRNRSRADYSVQGWKMHKLYPDFVFAKSEDTPLEWKKVYVIDTKGLHLMGNVKTEYMEDLFKVINEFGEVHEWSELGLQFPSKQFRFDVVPVNGWRERIRSILDS